MGSIDHPLSGMLIIGFTTVSQMRHLGLHPTCDVCQGTVPYFGPYELWDIPLHRPRK